MLTSYIGVASRSPTYIVPPASVASSASPLLCSSSMSYYASSVHCLPWRGVYLLYTCQYHGAHLVSWYCQCSPASDHLPPLPSPTSPIALSSPRFDAGSFQGLFSPLLLPSSKSSSQVLPLVMVQVRSLAYYVLRQIENRCTNVFIVAHCDCLRSHLLAPVVLMWTLPALLAQQLAVPYIFVLYSQFMETSYPS